MRTYLVVWFNSEGGRPQEITERLLSLGFKVMKGNYDYVYEWDRNATIDEILTFGDKVQLTLKGMDVLFKLETVDSKGTD